jgi:hypothetical protein
VAFDRILRMLGKELIANFSRFLDPVMVAEVAFCGWTRDCLIRQGTFRG